MTDPSTAQPIILRRVQMSTAAWALLCDSASTVLGLPLDTSDAAAPLSEEATSAGWAELKSLEMSPEPGEVTRQWTGAVALLLTAPITVTARATYNGVSTTSALGLRAGRGLAVHQRHASDQGAAGTTITGSEDSMEITLFNEENVWGAVSRLLPPLDLVRAPAKAAPMENEPALVLDAGTAQTALPEEVANVTLSVTTAAPGMTPRVWAGMWSVHDEELFSVTTRSGEAPEVRLTPVPAGHIAHELVFAVVGAHDTLTAAEKDSSEQGTGQDSSGQGGAQ